MTPLPRSLPDAFYTLNLLQTLQRPSGVFEKPAERRTLQLRGVIVEFRCTWSLEYFRCSKHLAHSGFETMLRQLQREYQISNFCFTNTSFEHVASSSRFRIPHSRLFHTPCISILALLLSMIKTVRLFLSSSSQASYSFRPTC